MKYSICQLTWILIFFIGFIQFYEDAQASIICIGSADNQNELPIESRLAYQFAQSNFDVRYVSISQILHHPEVLEEAATIWWHESGMPNLPSGIKQSKVKEAILTWIHKGGNLLLTGFSPQYVKILGLSQGPNISEFDPTISGQWGITQKRPHPIFNDLPATFYLASDGYLTKNRLCWWDDPSKFSGEWLGDVERNGNIVGVGEIKHGAGRVLVVGVGAYQWFQNHAINLNKKVLELFTKNMLAYLDREITSENKMPVEPIRNLRKHVKRVGLIVKANSIKSMDQESLAVYRWLKKHTDVRLITYKQLSEKKTIKKYDVLWWHYSQKGIPEAMLRGDVIRHVKDYLHQGGGILLTQFATTYAADLGLEYSSATTQLVEPKLSSGWGYKVRSLNHPIFAGLNETFLTVSSGVQVDNYVCWWDSPQKTRGIWLADIEVGANKLAMSEYRLGLGKVIVTGTGAYEWAIEGNKKSNKSNLEQLTRNMLAYLADSHSSTERKLVLDESTSNENRKLAAHWSFDRSDGFQAVESVSQREDAVASYLHDASWRAGVKGQCLEFDGYSTYVVSEEQNLQLNGDAFTIDAWIAVREYPTEFAPIVNNYSSGAGFQFGLTKHGQLRGSIKTSTQWREIQSKEALALNEWLHVAITFRKSGKLCLYVNGNLVASSRAGSESIQFAYDEKLLIGRDIRTGLIAGMFPTGMFNGLIDELRILGFEMPREQIYKTNRQHRPIAPPDLSVAYRFKDDLHRPRYHAMPTHAWANEPHGLIYFQGQYHITYQANPSGPYWNYIRWGHLVSDDLVQWKQKSVAIRPSDDREDKFGIWSGCAVEGDDGKLYFFYTGVNGSVASISVATSRDGELFKKHHGNPLITGRPKGNYDDFRDPVVWRDKRKLWHMAVGGSIPNKGGTIHHYTSKNLINWTYTGEPFTGNRSTSGRFWEMPVVLDFNGKTWLGVTEVPGRNSYWVGTWEHNQFIPLSPNPTRLDLFNHFLSPTVTKDENGHYVAIGIVPESRSSADQLKAGWAHTFGLPRRWRLNEDNVLLQSPHPSLKNLRGEPNEKIVQRYVLKENQSVVDFNKTGDQCEVELDLDVKNAEEICLVLRKSQDGKEQTKITYYPKQGEISLDRSESSLSNRWLPHHLKKQRKKLLLPLEGKIYFNIFIDKSVIECFINNQEVFSTRVYPSRSDANGIELSAVKGEVVIKKMTIWSIGDAQTVEYQNGK
ncbi:DUF4960 domain-containing protein [Poriferisphaera sp. WC338]|uniref:DUF4960 domain-containing protein n=1 Tax=Poriferisphaera sp. WC338 TaxID=3425129 RepID=UPI003D81B66A